MAPQDPEAAALLAHVLSQVESNVEFLVSQNYISRSDASAFLSKLPNTSNNTNGNTTKTLASRVKSMVTSNPAPAVPLPPRRPAATESQARALWAYNEKGQDPNDLSFSAGDIIEIVEETNADWWLGKVNGKQALFPSSYVERISGAAPVPRVTRSDRPAYKPFGAAYHGVDAPPAAGAGVNSVGLQQDPATEQKKSKFGKYGDTMAHSAAGGVGFGAGAAIGGGLVRAIF